MRGETQIRASVVKYQAICFPSLALNFTWIPNLHSTALTLSAPQSHGAKGRDWRILPLFFCPNCHQRNTADEDSPISKKKKNSFYIYFSIFIIITQISRIYTRKFLRIYMSHRHYDKFIAKIFSPQQL